MRGVRYLVLLVAIAVALSCGPSRVRVPDSSAGRRCQRECMAVYQACGSGWPIHLWPIAQLIMVPRCNHAEEQCLLTCDGAYLPADERTASSISEETERRRRKNLSSEEGPPQSRPQRCFDACASNAATGEVRPLEICCDVGLTRAECAAEQPSKIVDCPSADAGASDLDGGTVRDGVFE